LFTWALFFATFEVIDVINMLLLKVFPDFWPWYHQEKIMETFEILRPFGYLALAVVLVLIIAGFIVKKGYLSVIGSVGLYLPMFGYFAYTMFSLAGMGVLVALWFPFSDLSPNVLHLGNIIYVPYLILAYPFKFIGIDIGVILGCMLMDVGLLVFFMGAITWLYGKSGGFEIIDFWIYRCSRHPQYLGFLLWSYGLLLLAAVVSSQRSGYLPDSLPWLIVFPLRILLKKNCPENRREIAFTITFYGTIVILLSLPFSTVI